VYILVDDYMKMYEYMWMSLMNVFFNTNFSCHHVWIQILYKNVKLNEKWNFVVDNFYIWNNLNGKKYILK
jgi:hypothetical protein